MEVEKFEHAGLTCEIHIEEYAEDCDPRQWENLGTMVCWHPDYYRGDYQITDGNGRGAVKKAFHRNDFESMYQLRRYLGIAHGAVCILPLTVYEHSGITMFVGGKHDYPFDSAGWDTTVVGFIYATRADMERCGTPEDKVEGALKQEVETYDSWLRGEVYGWAVYDTDGEILDGCGGYVGDLDYVQREVKESAECLAKDIAINTEPNFPEGMRA
jgi:hypothetical protein